MCARVAGGVNPLHDTYTYNLFHVSLSFDNCNLLDLGNITAREIYETSRRDGCPLMITLRRFVNTQSESQASNGWDHVSFPGQGYEI